MTSPTPLPHKNHSQLILQLVIWGVAIDGLLTIGGTLVAQFTIHHLLHVAVALFGVPLVIGLTLLYLSSLLVRRKQTAWAITVVVYVLALGFNIVKLILLAEDHRFLPWSILHDIALPLVIVVGLVYYHREFKVKSDIESFRQALGLIIVVLGVTFSYGVAGFMLMDEHDFHREVSLPTAMHYSIDQLGLTIDHPLIAYTQRARVFTDSQSIISLAAVAYAALSLFQPLRARFVDQTHNREQMQALLKQYPASSEDFFKLWPHDKHYFFNDKMNAGLALQVRGRTALVVGDPAGETTAFPELLHQFEQLCHGNDWRGAFIHTDPKFAELYSSNGFNFQKIGEEAVLDIAHFQKAVAHNKYFRHITNKFTKQGYSTEILPPPHDRALIERLQTVSADWIARPGRTEYGFAMGYFSSEYLAQCPVMVVRDSAGTIQAFINQVPSFDKVEANFDMLRHTNSSPGNINDFLLTSFIQHLAKNNFTRLNLGLCPLAGLDKKEDNHSVIDSALRFAYANGDRLYSFSGLHRFKAKYEPQWSPRYIVYKGGIHGFTRTLNALNKAMKVKP